MNLFKRQLSAGMIGYDVSSLHNILKLFGFEISEEETKNNLFGDSTHNAVKQYQSKNHLDKSGAVDESTKSVLFKSAKEKGFFLVRGTLMTHSGVVARGLQVIAIDKSHDKDSLLGKTITDDNGHYLILYKRENLADKAKQNADLAIKIVDREDETKIHGITSVHFNADHDKKINIVLNDINRVPDKKSEFSRIIDDLNVCGLSNSFADIREDKDRQDISYLSSKTGWDARLIAIVSLSHKYFQESKIEPSFNYALFRFGLSTIADELYKTNSDTVHKIWSKAIKDLLIDQSLESKIDKNLRLYEEYQKKYLLENMKPTGVSSLKELLSISLKKDEDKQKRFIDLYFNNSGNIEEFWTKIENQFGTDTMKKLQLDSKLAYITMNNAKLIRKFRSAALKIKDPAHLIMQGFHKGDRWHDLFANVELSIPKEISGDNDQEKKENYINYMTSLLKKSYPTLVISEMIKTDELKVNDQSVKNEICDSLNKMYEKLEFQIGIQPVQKVLIDNPVIKIEDQALKEIKKIERIFQITPSDETMKVLWRSNLTSAVSIMQYDKNEFIKTFAENLGGQQIASTIYSKAHQVHSTVLNLAATCMTFKANPKIYALSQIREQDSELQRSVIENPTLENLFGGSLDHCDCEHCQSVLSPSSYLVDLLHFIDLKKLDSDKNEILPRTFELQNPLGVLLKKRPDLQHIQLTCENTNTILPYIDLVNEILEYFVVNHNLDGFEGFNIQGITTIELLANPQFVNEKAYTILKNQDYPFNLPFNRSLEYLRLLFSHLKIELNEAMEKFRVNENLDVSNNNNPEPYAWRDIYNEFLGISPQEYQRLTNSLKKIPAYFGEDENMSFNEFRDKLSNAKVFSEKTKITYNELIELVSTKFINPDSYLIPKLQKLTVSFADIKAFKEGDISPAAFREKIPTDINEQEYGGNVLNWVEDNYDKIMNLILLTLPNSESNDGEDFECRRFNELEFRYSLPDSSKNGLKEIEFWCLLRFIRLWKQFGWTIEETDKVINALYDKRYLPKEGTNDDLSVQKQKLDKGIKDLIIRVAHVKNIIGKLKLKRSKLVELLSLWSNIDVQGKNSLYRRMFLNSSISEIDSVFYENGSGEYLQDNEQDIEDQIDVLQAAFNLNMEDISLIMKDAGLESDSDLSLENVSEIFRNGFFANCLELSVEEFIMIKQMTALDPFAPLTDEEHSDVTVNPQILKFIDIVKVIKNSKFKTDTLNYYMQDKDITGQASPSAEVILPLAKTIKDGLVKIEQENAVDTAASSEAVKSRMALVYENHVVDRFFGLLNSVDQYSVEYSHSKEKLEPEIIEKSNKKIGYDDFAKVLTFRGVMTESVKEDLKAIQIESPGEFHDAIDKLYNKGELDFRNYFEIFPELLKLYEDYVSAAPDKDESAKMNDILKEFMPMLKKKQKHLFVKQTLGSLLDIDLSMVNEFLENQIVLHSSQKSNETDPLIKDFLDTEASGTSVRYYFLPEVNPEPDLEEPISGNVGEKLPANPNGGNIRAVWTFFLEVPVNENFKFYVETEPAANIEFSIDGIKVELIIDPDSSDPNSTVVCNKQPILLQSGKLYKIELQITNIKTKAILKWKAKGIGKSVIPLKYLYPDIQIQIFTNSYIRLLKAIGITERLSMCEKEISFFSTNDDYQIDNKSLFNCIPFDKKDPTGIIGDTVKLFNILLELLKYVSLKESLNIKDETLISILEDSNALDEGGKKIILKVTNWDEHVLLSILKRFGLIIESNILPKIKLSEFLRIYDAYNIVKKFGVNVDSLLSWISSDPSGTTISELKNALRSKYDQSSWFNVLQQANDVLRIKQRDALVSYILSEMQKNDETKIINTPDKLFEYFLIDVKMDSCMKTSRIKQAISTTQLFIHRCLMNLEPLVKSSSIKKNEWEWMQRYRMAEANEKVFLYPEDWLETELRDLKSPIFKELEGELLQEDLNDELAENAMVNYLEKLDEVSKLEVCATYLEENNTGNKYDDILHVFGRTTTGASCKYYYRRLEHGYWTAWEEISEEIEDNPILPVVWKNRLFLFWLNIVSKASEGAHLPANKNMIDLTTKDLNTSGKTSFEVNLCWSEYYNNKWQPRKTSDFKNPIVIFELEKKEGEIVRFDRFKIGMDSTIHIENDSSEILEIAVFYGKKDWITVTTPPQDKEPTVEDALVFVLTDTKNASIGEKFHRYGDLPHRSITRYLTNDLSPIYHLATGDRSDTIIAPGQDHLADTVTVGNNQPVSNPIEVPFFYQDVKHIFIVKPQQVPELVRNIDHVFTPRSKFGQNNIIENMTFPDLWEKPEIFNPLVTLIDNPMIARGILDSSSESSKPIDFYNKDNPLNKVLLDNKPILYDGAVIGPLGSRHASILYNNRIHTDEESEKVGMKW